VSLTVMQLQQPCMRQSVRIADTSQAQTAQQVLTPDLHYRSSGGVQLSLAHLSSHPF